MEKKIYISKEEQAKCKKVADAFSELYEMENIVVLDVGRYGFVKLQYYREPEGFQDMQTFTDSREMFENLWQEWLDTKLYLLAKDTPMSVMGYDEVFQCLPEKKQKELTDRRKDFAKKAAMEI